MLRGTFLLVAALSVAIAGCGKKDDGASAASCGPLEVTVDGKPVDGLTVGMGYKEKTTGGYLVYVFNHDKATCDELLAGQRQVPDGEVAVRGFAEAGKKGMMNSVGIGAHTQMGIDVSVVTEPKKQGDTVALCAKKAEFTPKIGDYKEKTVTVSGLLSGSYCGAQK